MTRSLVILDRLPYPPMGGQQLRYRQSIEALLALGRVTLLLLGGRNAGGVPADLELVTAEPATDRSSAHRWAAVLGRCGKKAVRAQLQARHQARLRRHIGAVLERSAPELVLVANAELAGYLPPLAAPGRAVVYDAHNVEQHLRRDLAPLRAKLGDAPDSPRFSERILTGEAALAAAVDEVWVCSDDDAHRFGCAYPRSRARIRVVPNTVDTLSLGRIAQTRTAPRPAGRPRSCSPRTSATPPTSRRPASSWARSGRG